jgi:tetratricopeptide (TPR) repeat protein
MRLCLSLILLGWSTLVGAQTNISVNANTDPRLKVFAAQKHKQMDELAAKLHVDVPPEAREFFKAAEDGDWIAVSNCYARIQRLTGLPETSCDEPAYTNALSVPIHETFNAYADFELFNPAMLRKYSDGILHSIPAGGIYFGGTDPGRFIITAVCDVAKSPDIFIITQNGLANARYMSYLRLIYGNQLWLPSVTNAQAAFQLYITDVQARQARGEHLSDEEEITVEGGAVQVRGVQGVMNINGILTKWIFDNNNAQHEFYVEESYVIPWMYPYMEPHGLILKLNKQPLPQLDSAIVARDRAFWDALTKELLADQRFLSNNWVRGTYAKLRATIGGLYAYRHMTAEALYAFKQSLDLCPESPEGAFRLAQLDMELGRTDDALATLESLQRLDPLNSKIPPAIDQIRAVGKARTEVPQLEAACSNNPRDFNTMVQLGQAYQKAGQGDRITPLFQRYLTQDGISSNGMLQTAQAYMDLGQPDAAVAALQLMTQRFPRDARAFYSIAMVRSSQHSTGEAIAMLSKAIQLMPNLRSRAASDPVFTPLRGNPQFQQLITSP